MKNIPAKDSSDFAYSREWALVDAQCLIQLALDNVLGNPRDKGKNDPKLEAKLFKEQRAYLSKTLGWSPNKVRRLFADGSNMTLKDLAEVICGLGYELELKFKEKEKTR